MRMRFAFLGLFTAAALVPSAAPAAAHDPRVGTWFERKGSPSYQSLHRSFEALADGRMRVSINMDRQGRAMSFAELTCDGRPYPVQGQVADGQMTLACSPVDERTTAFTFVRRADAGWVKSAGREQVSADGQVMTVSAVQTDANGVVTARIERVFDRQPSVRRTAPGRSSLATRTSAPPAPAVSRSAGSPRTGASSGRIARPRSGRRAASRSVPRRGGIA